MAIVSSNFSSNTLSGTVTVRGGIANINLGVVNPFYLDGQKTFVVKLRKNSVDGAVVGTSTPILIPDRSRIVSVTANVASVNEGDLVQYNITTANVAQDTILYYDTDSLTGSINVSDFNGGNTGTVLIQNNAGSFTLRALADLSLTDESNESYKINLRATSASGNVVYNSSAVNINDTSNTVTVLSATANTQIMYDTDLVRFDVNTLNASGTTLYYTVTGSILTSEIVGDGIGTFVPNGYDATTAIVLRGNGISADPRNMKLQIRETSAAGNIRFTSSNVFLTTRPPLLTGGIVTTSGNFTTHVFTSPGALSVTAVSPLRANVDYYLIGGGGGGGHVAEGYGETYAGGAGGVNIGNLQLQAGATYTATIGAGGTGGLSQGGYSATLGAPGSNTTLSSPTLPVALVGYAGGGPASPGSTGAGGSGGGASPTGGAGNGPAWGFPGPGAQGFPGGTGNNRGGGGGGRGGSGNAANGAGGIGIVIDTPAAFGTDGPSPGRWFAGGGGTRVTLYPAPVAQNIGSWDPRVAGGAGGGGPSSVNYTVATGSPLMTGNAGIQNTGGGGGSASVNFSPNAGGDGAPGGQGGSGIVIIRYNSAAGGSWSYNP
jgi:hypothetical protein